MSDWSLRVVTALPEQRDQVAFVLARAFADESHFAHLLGQNREAALVHVMRMQLDDACTSRASSSLREGSRNEVGCVDVVGNGRGDVVAAAVWLRPGAWPMTAARVVRSMRHLAGVAMTAGPVAAWKLVRFGQRSSLRHPAEPHWYLTTLGVEPGHWGWGLGRVLIEHRLRRADHQRRAVFLETQEPETASWYTSMGFAPFGNALEFAGFTSMPMMRPPRSIQ